MSTVRGTGRCLSIKSRREPDVQCSHAATRGNFCGRHASSANVFVTATGTPKTQLSRPTTKSTTKSATKTVKKAGNRMVVCKSAVSIERPYEPCTTPAISTGDYCNTHIAAPIILRVKCIQPIIQHTTKAAIVVRNWWRHRYFIRRYATWRLHGPATFDRTLMSNETDFFTFDTCNEILAPYFFSFRDTDGFVYGFDARSLFRLQELSRGSGVENPYTRLPFSSTVIARLATLRRVIETAGLSTCHAGPANLTPEQLFRFKVVDLCQTIDELDFYTDPEWILTLDVRRLHIFYHMLVDIFFSRAGLTHARRKELVPCTYETNPFRMNIAEFMSGTELQPLREYAVDCIRKIVSLSPDRNNRKLGAMYVLMALSAVSRSCARAYPYLAE